MSRGSTSLLLILLIQCAMVIALYWPEGAPEHSAAGTLVPFATDQVAEIQVGDEFDNETILRNAGGRWFLPEVENLPADGTMAERLLEAVTSGNESWPVADSAAARQRFRVASYHYRRRIRLLEENEVLGIFYLGTSPGFGKVYIRNASQDAIYSIAFSAHEAPGNSGAWLDRKLLQIRAPVSITADAYSLHREGGSWRSGIGRVPDERELTALLSVLRSIQVDGIANEDEQRNLAEAEADLALNVQGLAGEVTLEIFSQGDEYFIHSSEYPLFFTLSAYDHDRLVSIDFRLISGEAAENQPLLSGANCNKKGAAMVNCTPHPTNSRRSRR